MTKTLEHSMGRLATWLGRPEHQRRFVVADGPFVDDPEAAVEVAAQSLMAASRACREAFNAVERAHIASAHIASS